MVAPLSGDQLVMGSPLHDLPVLDDQDLVGLANGAQAVGDDKGGAPPDQLIQTFLNEDLALGIQIGGGFVQYQDSGIRQQRPGNGHSLPLSPLRA